MCQESTAFNFEQSKKPTVPDTVNIAIAEGLGLQWFLVQALEQSDGIVVHWGIVPVLRTVSRRHGSTFSS